MERIYGIDVTIYDTVNDEGYDAAVELPTQFINRIAKHTGTTSMWANIKQFVVLQDVLYRGDMHIHILFNQMLTSEECDMFIKTCHDFGPNSHEILKVECET